MLTGNVHDTAIIGRVGPGKGDQGMNRGRLLVLDDDDTVGQILCLGAQAAGFEARLCLRVDEFLQALVAWTPSHVSVDLRLAGSSGDEVLVALAGAGCRARVIVCSGAGPAALDQALAQAHALGLTVAGALEKPFTLATLRGLLHAPQA